MKRTCLLLLALCLLTGVQAQKFYNLRYCLELGLQNNYDLRIAHNNEQISDNNATWANAGLLPTLDFSAGYVGNADKSSTTDRATGTTTKDPSTFNQSADVGLNLNWTLFDGFSMTADYKRLRELKRQGETNTRIAIEDMVANIASEYYNFIQQKIRLKNFLYAVSLSKERVRVAETRHIVGSGCASPKRASRWATSRASTCCKPASTSTPTAPSTSSNRRPCTPRASASTN